MKKNRVLVVGMLDSIHISRWIAQFEGSGLKIILFPSSHFRKVHSGLIKFQDPRLKILGLSLFGNKLGYADSLFTLRFLSNAVSLRIRGMLLSLVVQIFHPDVIHAIEIQHAGYLVSSIKKGARRQIVTNWGSDIYYFQHRPEHLQKIKKALAWATHYSAECERDYELASRYGFEGVYLPKIPNAGGFENYNANSACSDRRLILVKCYGGKFGAGKIAIEAVRDFLLQSTDFQVFFYSVTDDLLREIQNLTLEFPREVRFSTIRKSISQSDLMTLFSQARVYLGCSYSDGLSTSFLQALVTGAFPIQTNTSCASELVLQGAVGRVISPTQNEVLNSLQDVVFDTELLNYAQEKNLAFSSDFLDAQSIAEKAFKYYAP